MFTAKFWSRRAEESCCVHKHGWRGGCYLHLLLNIFIFMVPVVQRRPLPPIHISSVWGACLNSFTDDHSLLWIHIKKYQYFTAEDVWYYLHIGAECWHLPWTVSSNSSIGLDHEIPAYFTDRYGQVGKVWGRNFVLPITGIDPAAVWHIEPSGSQSGVRRYKYY